jgi:hypothetical protein
VTAVAEHPTSKGVAMTTKVVSPVATIARRFRLGRQVDGRDRTGTRAFGSEHEPVVLSRHRTSEGVVTYTRCTCGDLQVWLTGGGRPAHLLADVSGSPADAGG